MTRQLTVLALVLTCWPRVAVAELAGAWALDDGTKVKATDTDHRLRSNNGVFDAKARRVRLFGARNETVAFQLILVGGAAKTDEVAVRLPAIGPLSNSPESKLAEPDRYLVGRRIELLAQHYVEVKAASRSITWEPWTPAAPKGMTGWLPDALIPLTDGGTVSVPARRNQGIWVDVYIPKDTPPGTHRGELSIEVGGGPCGLAGGCKLTVELEVLELTLPDQPATKTMVYFSGGEDDWGNGMPSRYVEDAYKADDTGELQALFDRHYKLLRRHRLTAIIGQDKKPTEALKKRLDGSAFSRAAGYEGPGEGLGQDVYSIHTYGGELTPKQAREWSSWFAKHAPKVTHFLYVVDEPSGDEAFAKANAVAKRAAPVPAFVTHAFDAKLDGFSIFCAMPSHYSLEQVQEAKQAGKRAWIYNGVRPFSGSFMTDDVAVATRVNPWIQHKYKIPRWFYWEATYYFDGQGDRGQIDVFSMANNFRNGDGDALNGDGLLLYPGRDRHFPKQDRGINMPLPTIRLKNWRRGIEDIEYLVAARKAGHGAFVDKLLQTLVPSALADEREATAPVTWPEDGEKWLAARRQLATLLSTGKAAPIDTSKLAAPAEPKMQQLKRKVRTLARSIGKKRLLAIGGAGVLACVAFVAWLIHRRRRRRRDDRFE